MRNLNVYQCKSKLLPGHKYGDVLKIARKILNSIASKTKRRPYIRSTYFKGEKIFLDNFWEHLTQKNITDRKWRLKFLECAIEYIENSKDSPILKINDNHQTFYRFIGQVGEHFFAIQIKEDLKRKQKFLMSIFDLSHKRNNPQPR